MLSRFCLSVVLFHFAASAQATCFYEGEYFKVGARNWSTNGQGIAVALTRPENPEVSNERMQELLETGFTQLNGEPLPIRVFFCHRSTQPADAFTFFVFGAPYGPFGLTEAAENMPAVVLDYQAVQREWLQHH